MSLPPLVEGPVQGRLDVLVLRPFLVPALSINQSLEVSILWWGCEKPCQKILSQSSEEVKFVYDIRSNLPAFRNYLSDSKYVEISLKVSECTDSHNVAKENIKKLKCRQEWLSDDHIGQVIIKDAKLNIRGEFVAECDIVDNFGCECGSLVVFLLHTKMDNEQLERINSREESTVCSENKVDYPERNYSVETMERVSKELTVDYGKDSTLLSPFKLPNKFKSNSPLKRGILKNLKNKSPIAKEYPKPWRSGMRIYEQREKLLKENSVNDKDYHNNSSINQDESMNSSLWRSFGQAPNPGDSLTMSQVYSFVESGAISSSQFPALVDICHGESPSINSSTEFSDYESIKKMSAWKNHEYVPIKNINFRKNVTQIPGKYKMPLNDTSEMDQNKKGTNAPAKVSTNKILEDRSENIASHTNTKVNYKKSLFYEVDKSTVYQQNINSIDKRKEVSPNKFMNKNCVLTNVELPLVENGKQCRSILNETFDTTSNSKILQSPESKECSMLMIRLSHITLQMLPHDESKGIKLKGPFIRKPNRMCFFVEIILEPHDQSVSEILLQKEVFISRHVENGAVLFNAMKLFQLPENIFEDEGSWIRIRVSSRRLDQRSRDIIGTAIVPLSYLVIPNDHVLLPIWDVAINKEKKPDIDDDDPNNKRIDVKPPSSIEDDHPVGMVCLRANFAFVDKKSDGYINFHLNSLCQQDEENDIPSQDNSIQYKEQHKESLKNTCPINQSNQILKNSQQVLEKAQQILENTQTKNSSGSSTDLYIESVFSNDSDDTNEYMNHTVLWPVVEVSVYNALLQGAYSFTKRVAPYSSYVCVSVGSSYSHSPIVKNTNSPVFNYGVELPLLLINGIMRDSFVLLEVFEVHNPDKYSNKNDSLIAFCKIEVDSMEDLFTLYDRMGQDCGMIQASVRIRSLCHEASIGKCLTPSKNANESKSMDKHTSVQAADLFEAPDHDEGFDINKAKKYESCENSEINKVEASAKHTPSRSLSNVSRNNDDDLSPQVSRNMGCRLSDDDVESLFHRNKQKNFRRPLSANMPKKYGSDSSSHLKEITDVQRFDESSPLITNKVLRSKHISRNKFISNDKAKEKYDSNYIPSQISTYSLINDRQRDSPHSSERFVLKSQTPQKSKKDSPIIKSILKKVPDSLSPYKINSSQNKDLPHIDSILNREISNSFSYKTYPRSNQESPIIKSILKKVPDSLSPYKRHSHPSNNSSGKHSLRKVSDASPYRIQTSNNDSSPTKSILKKASNKLLSHGNINNPESPLEDFMWMNVIDIDSPCASYIDRRMGSSSDIESSDYSHGDTYIVSRSDSARSPDFSRRGLKNTDVFNNGRNLYEPSEEETVYEEFNEDYFTENSDSEIFEDEVSNDKENINCNIPFILKKKSRIAANLGFM